MTDSSIWQLFLKIIEGKHQIKWKNSPAVKKAYEPTEVNILSINHKLYNF